MTVLLSHIKVSQITDHSFLSSQISKSEISFVGAQILEMARFVENIYIIIYNIYIYIIYNKFITHKILAHRIN